MKKIIIQLVKWLSRLSQPTIIGLGVILIIIISIIDFLISIDLSIAIFDLIPIVILTWFVNLNIGIAASIVCSISLLLADMSLQKHSHFLLIFWNIGVRLGFYLITNFLLWELKLGYEKESMLARTV